MQTQTILLGNPVTLQFVVTNLAGVLMDATGAVTFTIEPVGGVVPTILTGVRTAFATYQYPWLPTTAGLYNIYAASLGPNKTDSGQIYVSQSPIV